MQRELCAQECRPEAVYSLVVRRAISPEYVNRRIFLCSRIFTKCIPCWNQGPLKNGIPSRVVGFSLRIESYQDDGDDTGVNGIRILTLQPDDPVLPGGASSATEILVTNGRAI